MSEDPKDYTTIRIPKEIGHLVDEMIDSEFGFKSRAEVVKEAIRAYYLRLKELRNIKLSEG